MSLKIDELHAGYGKMEILHGVTLELSPGEMVALIGANGAGKTTLLHSILRIEPPQGPMVRGGKIDFEGKSLLPLATYDLVRKHRIALVPEGRHIFGNLSVLHNLHLATYGRNDTAKVTADMQRVFELFPRLAERQQQRSELLSGGEQQMLAVGRALMSSCKTLLLDEPSMGLSPKLTQELFQKLHELNQQGLTILVVEQNAMIALKYAHRAYILENGRIVATGKSQELLQRSGIHSAYLGAI
jgi:branched-chain amino acid transport system ATP-binding protein